MNKPNIILVGGGGNCKACIDVIEQEGKYNIAGIIDVQEKVGTTILAYPIIATDNDLPEIAKKYDNFFITLGQIKSAKLRTQLFQKIKKLGKVLPTIISPLAYIAKDVKIGEGTIIMHHALINTSAVIGSNCIVNTKALIEHDTIIKNNCHIATTTTINGNCIINDACFIGSGATINQGISIANNCIIGSGAVVIKDIDVANNSWIGNPAKKMAE